MTAWIDANTSASPLFSDMDGLGNPFVDADTVNITKDLTADVSHTMGLVTSCANWIVNAGVVVTHGANFTNTGTADIAGTIVPATFTISYGDDFTLRATGVFCLVASNYTLKLYGNVLFEAGSTMLNRATGNCVYLYANTKNITVHNNGCNLTCNQAHWLTYGNAPFTITMFEGDPVETTLYYLDGYQGYYPSCYIKRSTTFQNYLFGNSSTQPYLIDATAGSITITIGTDTASGNISSTEAINNTVNTVYITAKNINFVVSYAMVYTHSVAGAKIDLKWCRINTTTLGNGVIITLSGNCTNGGFTLAATDEIRSTVAGLTFNPISTNINFIVNGILRLTGTSGNNIILNGYRSLTFGGTKSGILNYVTITGIGTVPTGGYGWNLGPDISIANGASAEMNNCTLTNNRVGMQGPTGWLVSKNHNGVAGDYRIWGILTMSAPDLSYRTTCADNCTLKVATIYSVAGGAFNTALTVDIDTSVNVIYTESATMVTSLIMATASVVNLSTLTQSTLTSGYTVNPGVILTICSAVGGVGLGGASGMAGISAEVAEAMNKEWSEYITKEMQTRPILTSSGPIYLNTTDMLFGQEEQPEQQEENVGYQVGNRIIFRKKKR